MVLEVDNLTVTKGAKPVVQGVSLRLEPGKITAVLGANGAGKSELVLGIAGVLPLAKGGVKLDRTSLAGRGPGAVRTAGVAAVPEGHRVLTRLSVDDNLRAAGSLLDQVEPTLSDTYALFPELAERKGQIAGTLSGGQQQMVALAHAMMCRPRFLLIDEMSLGLAPLVVKRLMGFVSGLRERGVGVLLIEQFTDLALGIADDAIVLRSGKMRYSGPAKSLLDDPAKLDAAYFGGENS